MKVINYPIFSSSFYWIVIAGFLLTGCYETTRQITPYSDRDYQKSYKHGEDHYSIVSKGAHKVTMVSLQKASGVRVQFTIAVENGSAAPITFGFNDVNAVTADKLYLYINTLGDLNKEIADQERHRMFLNSIATGLAEVSAQAPMVQYGRVGSKTYKVVTYDPAIAVIQQRMAQEDGRRRENDIRNQADDARHNYSSKILKAKELKPGEKVEGSLWIEIPYDRSGMVYFTVYVGRERHLLAFKVGE